MSDFLTLAQERYSCRKFDTKPVEKEKIERMIDAAIAAPTAVNKQPWHAWIIESEEAKAKIRECTPFHFDAPVYILVGGNAEEAWMRKGDDRNFEDVDAAIVGTHIMMEAQELGIGSTWVAVFDVEKVQEAFPQTQGYDLIALFTLGYPAEKAHPAKLHFETREREELATWL